MTNQKSPTKPSSQAARLQKALDFYRKSKKEIDQNILINEDWFRARHWKYIKGSQMPLGHGPTTPFIFNAVWNKHADAMDYYPEPIFLEREENDRPLAETLSKIVPLVLEKNDFERIYSDVWWQKLKQGTGIYYVGWDNTKENGLGDIVISKVDLLRFYAQPHIDDLQRSQYIFVLSLADTDCLKKEYPGKPIESDVAAVTLQSYFGSYSDEELSGKSCLIDCYEKDRTPSGREIVHLTKMVGDTILYSTKSDPAFRDKGLYAHGQYPFVADPFVPIENSLYGMGLVEIAKPTQEYIDRLDYLIESNCLVAGRQRFIVKRSSGIRSEDVRNLSKDFIECDSSADDSVVRPLQAAAFPAHIMEHRQHKVEELKEVVGNRDFSQGGISGGVTAFKSISALQEAGNKLSRDVLKSSYRAFKQIAELCVELIREFYDEARSFRIIGANGKAAYLSLSNRELKSKKSVCPTGADSYHKAIFDIQVMPKRKNAFDAEQHNTLIRELFESGAFSPEKAESTMIALDAMMLENKGSIIRALEKIKADRK